jgi:hypothetical protein
MNIDDVSGHNPELQSSGDPSSKQVQEQRRYERMRASLSIKFRPVDLEEEAVLEKQGHYVAPAAFKGNTAETRDLNKLVSEDNGVSEDISLGGLKLTTMVPIAEGTRLCLEIVFPEVPIPVNATAEVRWCRQMEDQWSSGLKFIGISKTDLEKVERFLVLQKRALFAKRG